MQNVFRVMFLRRSINEGSGLLRSASRAQQGAWTRGVGEQGSPLSPHISSHLMNIHEPKAVRVLAR